jgi:hypothetical protein
MIAALAVQTFARQRAVQASLARRAEALAAVRIARHLLGRELRAGDGSAEVAADTLALRAYRGVGIVCAASADARDMVVRVDGVREPDPAKDSVRLVGAEGGDVVLALVARAPAPADCPAVSGTAIERWRLSRDAPPAPLLARYFERGSYHLDRGALRYRRGGAGRQPLTPEVLLTPPSRFVPGGLGGLGGAASLGLELYLPGDSGAAPSLVLSLGR